MKLVWSGDSAAARHHLGLLGGHLHLQQRLWRRTLLCCHVTSLHLNVDDGDLWLWHSRDVSASSDNVIDIDDVENERICRWDQAHSIHVWLTCDLSEIVRLINVLLTYILTLLNRLVFVSRVQCCYKLSCRRECDALYTVSKKTVQICFCQNFVKFPPILIIFYRKMAKGLKLCDLHPFLPERDYVTFGSLLSQIRMSLVCRLSSVCMWRWCTLLRGLKLSAIFLYRCVRWPSSDLRAKFYGDRPRGTPPSGALNARGVSK